MINPMTEAAHVITENRAVDLNPHQEMEVRHTEQALHLQAADMSDEEFLSLMEMMQAETQRLQDEIDSLVANGHGELATNIDLQQSLMNDVFKAEYAKLRGQQMAHQAFKSFV